MAQAARPPAPAPARPRAPRHTARRVPAVLTLAALLAALAAIAPLPPGPAAAEPPQARRAGEEVVVGDCLRLAVLAITDRNGALDPVDWVTLQVTNGCREPVRHLQVDLLLEDVFGKVYGVRTWVLERGEVLLPGRSKTERYPVPDPADHLPRRWAVRLRHVEKPSDRLRQAAPPAAVGRDAEAAAVAAALAAAAQRGRPAAQSPAARRPPATPPPPAVTRPAPAVSPPAPAGRSASRGQAPSDPRRAVSPRRAPAG